MVEQVNRDFIITLDNGTTVSLDSLGWSNQYGHTWLFYEDKLCEHLINIDKVVSVQRERRDDD
jgi:hypothetical protein